MISGQQLSNDVTRANNASMAITWQRLCREQYIMAQVAYENGCYRSAAFHQRQGARDHKIMRGYLERAL